MRVPRLYHPGSLVEGTEVELSTEAGHHATRVLRLAPGAALVLFCGDGGEHEAVLSASGRDGVRARVGVRHLPAVESPRPFTLVQGLTRGERMDLVLQKAVELGVARLDVVVTERCVVRLEGKRETQRLAHWQGVVRGAAEQSGRVQVPVVRGPVRLADRLTETAGPDVLRLVLDPASTTGLRELDAPAGAVEVLVGPEGGLSDAELAAARSAGWRGVRLGPRILRTETAGLTALAALQTLWGDLG